MPTCVISNLIHALMHALIVLNYLSPPLRLPLGIPMKIAPLRYKDVSAEERLSSITDSSLV